MAEITHLYEKFHPEHYDLKITVDREHKTIDGTSTITGEALTPEITVNQKFMTIKSVQANDQDVPFTFDDDSEAIHITLPTSGKVTLAIAYQAPLTDTMMGIYPSYYEVDGERKQLIGTQFETTFARQAFPCVDEPEAKATFDLAIKFDEHPGETIIANMPETKCEDGFHYFDTTVRMSTYLVAFAFGEMQSKMTTTKSGVKVGVFATKAHQPKELDFALDIAKRGIEFYEDFYQTPYPLPHSWQLALPDFSAGAMENWGLITYREATLMLNPDNTSLARKQYVATVITHELAHQWFGDLVTMKWWDDLWLNESFANMMEYVSVDALEPDWHIWELFQTSEAPLALQRDATDGVQPIHVHVQDPAEIDAIFDGAIVYAKGSRMLVMVRALIGDDAMRKGLKNYFEAHKYHNATGDDLWQALGDAAGMDIGSIMKSWLNQPGFPVVTAKVENGNLVLDQQQFFIGDGKEAGRTWQIPLNSNYAAAPTIMRDKRIVLGNYQELREKEGVPFRLNAGNNSHFIVKYDQRLLDDILAHKDELDHITQRQILQDLRLLAEGRQISYAELVPLLNEFADSTSSIVNDALYAIADKLDQFVTPETDEEKNYQFLLNKLSAHQVQRLGWHPATTESKDDQMTRPYVLKAALAANNQDAITAAHELFTANLENLEGVNADIRPLILKSEVQHYGNEELFNALLNQYVTTSDPNYKTDICNALTATKDHTFMTELLTKFEKAAVIKPQDLRFWYNGLLTNPAGEQAAWDWLRAEWDWLEKTVGGDMEFSRFITVTANAFHTEERLDEFKGFFEPKINTPGLTREITMDIRIIESHVALVASERQAVNKAIAAE